MTQEGSREKLSFSQQPPRGHSGGQDLSRPSKIHKGFLPLPLSLAEGMGIRARSACWTSQRHLSGTHGRARSFVKQLFYKHPACRCVSVRIIHLAGVVPGESKGQLGDLSSSRW